PGTALGIEAPPTEPTTQVGAVDRVDAELGIDGLDPLPDVQPVVVLLRALVRVQRLEVAQRPLALAGSSPRWARTRWLVGHAKGNLSVSWKRGDAVSECETDGAGDALEVHMAAAHQRHDPRARAGNRSVAHANSVAHYRYVLDRAPGCAAAC